MPVERVTLTHDTDNNGWHLAGKVFCSGCGSPASEPPEPMYREVVLDGDGAIMGHLHLCGCCGTVTWRPVS